MLSVHNIVNVNNKFIGDFIAKKVEDMCNHIVIFYNYLSLERSDYKKVITFTKCMYPNCDKDVEKNTVYCKEHLYSDKVEKSLLYVPSIISYDMVYYIISEIYNCKEFFSITSLSEDYSNIEKTNIKDFLINLVKDSLKISVSDIIKNKLQNFNTIVDPKVEQLVINYIATCLNNIIFVEGNINMEEKFTVMQEFVLTNKREYDDYNLNSPTQNLILQAFVYIIVSFCDWLEINLVTLNEVFSSLDFIVLSRLKQYYKQSLKEFSNNFKINYDDIIKIKNAFIKYDLVIEQDAVDEILRNIYFLEFLFNNNIEVREKENYSNLIQKIVNILSVQDKYVCSNNINISKFIKEKNDIYKAIKKVDNCVEINIDKTLFAMKGYINKDKINIFKHLLLEDFYTNYPDKNNLFFIYYLIYDHIGFQIELNDLKGNVYTFYKKVAFYSDQNILLNFLEKQFMNIDFANYATRQYMVKNEEQIYLTSDYPIQNYIPVNKKDRKYDLDFEYKTRHWGQRKLLISEIQFLTNAVSTIKNNKKFLVLYPGSAPGIHIPFLIELFKEYNIEYHLYDPRDFSPQLKRMSNVVINKYKDSQLPLGFFTDEIAKKYADSEYNVLFISDIRLTPTNSKNLTAQEYDIEFEKIVLEDLKRQQNWLYIIKPELSSLKFRLPFNYKSKYFEYLLGKNYFQCWSPLASTETRLFVKKSELNSVAIYDIKKYEKQLAYYNIIKRHDDKLKKYSLSTLNFNIVDGNKNTLKNLSKIDDLYSFDVYLEARILTDYLNLINKDNVMFKDLYILMDRITNEIVKY